MRKRLSRRGLLRAAGVAGLTGLAGCSAASDLLENRKSPNWAADLGEEAMAGPPALAGDALYVGAGDKALYGLDAADGSQQFRVETGGPIEARPAPTPENDGPVAVHSTDGDCYGVSRMGERLWTDEGTEPEGALARAGSTLLELSSPHHREPNLVTGYDAVTGEQRFQRPSESYWLSGVTENRLVLPTDPEPESRQDRWKLVGIDAADGRTVWETEASSSFPALAIDDDLAVAVRDTDDEVRITARNPADGSWRWETGLTGELAYFWSPVLAESVYVAIETPGGHKRGEPELFALSRADGSMRWRGPVGQQVRAVAADERGVFVSSRVTSEGVSVPQVSAFDLGGERRWEKTFSNEYGEMEELWHAGDAVVANDGNELVALDPDTGEQRWGYREKQGSRLEVVADGSALYVSHADRGTVVRFDA